MIYKIGDIVRGKVTGIEDYGIFILLDDKVSGLIHISEISHSFVKNVLDYVQLDDYIYAKVIDIDEENQKLKLSIKDIDYRNNGKSKHGIVETKGGFTKLHSSLDEWIREKVAEIEKK